MIPGIMITFETVARKAQVSRSWLYTQPDIRTEIERLRALGRRTAPAPLLARQRSSDPSLQKRLEAINSRNRDLARRTPGAPRLAESLGLLRAAGIRIRVTDTATRLRTTLFGNNHPANRRSKTPRGSTP